MTTSRIAWNGGRWYLNGVNYPWKDYGNDFGGSGWGAFGVHDPHTNAGVDRDFERIEQQGIHSVRWWLFSDGHAGVVWDGKGMPARLDEYVFHDLDGALALAEKHHLYLDLVLTDFTLMYDAQQINGVQQGGRVSVIDTASGQHAFIDNVLKPILERYGQNQYILGYEVMNEPEWGIREDNAVDSKISHPTSLANFQRFTRDIAATIHAKTKSYVTVGSAAMSWVEQWKGLGLDFYSVHYYESSSPSSQEELYDTDYSKLKLDAPVVVGEYQPGGRRASFRQYLDNWFNRGYAGAFVWSFNGVDRYGVPDGRVMKSWNSAHASATDIKSG